MSDILSGPAFTNPENLTVNLIPDGTARGSSPIGGQNLVVYAGADNKEATYLFAQFLNSTASQVTVAESDSLLPTRKSAYDQLKASTVPRVRFVRDFQPVMDRATERPWIPELSLAYPSMDEQWVRMYTGGVSAQQGRTTWRRRGWSSCRATTPTSSRADPGGCRRRSWKFMIFLRDPADHHAIVGPARHDGGW